MPPMRYYRPDFRCIYSNLKLYDMERATVRMDSSYDTITKIVERDSLNETQTASLVRDYTFATSIPLPDICFEIIMGSIWPSSAQRGGHQNSITGNPSNATVNIDTANNTMPSPPSSAPDSPGPDTAVDADTANSATETPPEADGPSTSGSSSSGPTDGGLHPPSSSPSASVVLPKIECIFPMPTGRGLKRTQNFTELQAPGSQTIILGPPPRPSLFPTYGPDAFPPLNNISSASSGISSSGATADITEEVASVSGVQPGVTSAENPTGNSTGTTPGITEVASASGPQPAASAQGPTSDLTGTTSGITANASGTQPVKLSPKSLTSNSKKRSRDNQDDEEERTRPTARLHRKGPSKSSLPDDTNAAPALTLVPSGNGEGSSGSGNGNPKKRSRDAEEDEEEIARPSTRTRQESSAVRPRYSSPTFEDRRHGRIIAPLRKSRRFNPRSSSTEIAKEGSTKE